jgi:hypothetical protein
MALRANSVKSARLARSISTGRLGEFLLHWPWELVLLLIGCGWLYRQTLPPGISSWIVEGWDSAMLQVAGSTWGIPHSPGYPLYTILSNLFVRLLGLAPGASDTPIVWRVSFWSTVTSLLTLIFTYLTVRKLVRSRAAAVIASGILGLSFVFWRGAIMAEVYSLNALIFALTYWLALTWADDPRDRWLIALGLTLGAGLAHHRTAFILPPTIALWVWLKYLKNRCVHATEQGQSKHWQVVVRAWLILGGTALVPLLSYLYLPWAAQNRVGQTWLYADTSDWNTFWFVVLAREWWGLVDIPHTAGAWASALEALFRQQADQITTAGVIMGIIGLIATRRYLWLFGPPFLALTLFGISYQVADVDSMLIPLTLTLCLGLGNLIGIFTRYLLDLLKLSRSNFRGVRHAYVPNNAASFDRLRTGCGRAGSSNLDLLKLMKSIGAGGETSRNGWLGMTSQVVLSLGLVIGAYLLFRPVAEANYEAVDLSGDWQAVDLVEEIVAIAGAGTPLTIVGQDNSVLPDLIYARVVLGQPVEPLSITTLSRMPEADSRALLQNRLEQGRRVLVDNETVSPETGFIPWLIEATDAGQIFPPKKFFLAPTGHPFLWELLPRPMPNVLPKDEAWQQLASGQFLDGHVSIIAHHQQIVPKRTGCFLRLTLFWQAEEYLGEDYYVSVRPVGSEAVLDKNDHLGLMRGYLPTSQLQPGEVVRDEVDLLIRQPAALPEVRLKVNLYQVEGDQFPTFGEVTLPVTVAPEGCATLRNELEIYWLNKS